MDVFQRITCSAEWRLKITIETFSSTKTSLDFKQILDSLPKTSPLIVCGDMNLATVDWNTLCSSDDYEQRVIDLFDHHMLRQVVDFPTCANNTIDLVFQRKCNI